MIKISLFFLILGTFAFSNEIKISKLTYKFVLDESKPNSTFFSVSVPYVQNIDRELLELIYSDLEFDIDKTDKPLNTNYLFEQVELKFNEFNVSYNQILEELKNEDEEIRNRLIYTYDETYQLKMFNGFITLTKNLTYYSGGAHSNYKTFHFNYSSNNKKKLLLNDIIKNRDSLLVIAESKFRKIYKIPNNLSINTTGFQFPEGKFEISENFLIEKDGFVFIWNTYEIAPYAYGQITLKLTFSELENILNENYNFY